MNTYCGPATSITDCAAVVCSNYDYPIIRIDTNQGVYGIGEVRDAGHRENALQFKSILLGQNPCNVDMIMRAIKPYGASGREGGGVSGIELALWDLVGKVYGVPCYQFLGGKYRDRIRIYADTPSPAEPTPEGYVERVKGRLAMGLTFIKFDVGGVGDGCGGDVGNAIRVPQARRGRRGGSGAVRTRVSRGSSGKACARPWAGTCRASTILATCR